ncbi:MAG: S-layer homology domain-containing protein [Clostridia bacterium]|nr:S-layer homology domain-containing protein [Clostridia bacterium]
MKARKILSAFLAALMLLSICTIGISAEDTLPFTDVPKGEWYYDAVAYTFGAGLMNGTGDGTKFSPMTTLTRGMVVTVLYRNERANKYEYKNPSDNNFDGFIDVNIGAYYYDAVMWAGQNNIVNGTGTNEWGEYYFSPDRSITRQELATMFMRYAEYKYVINSGKADLSKYPDITSVASWATDAVAWSVYAGLITGKAGGGVTTLSPTDTATRAEFATIIQRYNNADFDYESAFNMPIPLQSFTEPVLEVRNDADIFVAVDGNDKNPGTLDKPLATFGAAVAKVRELKKTAKDEIVVAFKGGNYGAFTQEFTEADSGNEKIPVTYCAYGDGEVVFDAGFQVSLDEFSPITDAEKYLFPQNATSHIKKADLSEKSYVGELTMFSYLYSDEEMQVQARFPNANNSKTPVAYANSVVAEPPGPHEYHAQLIPNLAARFDKYHTYENILFTGVFGNEYYGNYLRLIDYDPETDFFTLEKRPHVGMYTSAKMIFHNISEELDSKNEYWIDLDTKTLYVYDPHSNYSVATAGCFVNIEENANYLNFKGFSFKHINNDYAFFIKGDNITIDACTFFGIGDEFTIYSYGQNFRLTRSEFSDLCGGGVIVRNSGDRDMVVSGGLVIDNNSFHDFEKMYLTYKPAVLIQEAVGAQITHNEIYNGIHSGIIYGNAEFQYRFPYSDYVIESGKMPENGYLDNELYYINNKIEYNFIHDLFNSTIVGDAATIYIPRSVADAGNEINYNIIANVNHMAAWGIYLDDGMGNVSVKGNVFYDPGMYAILMSGGSYNTICDNVCIRTTFKSYPMLRIWPKYAEMLYDGLSSLKSSPTWPAVLKSYEKIPTDPAALAIWKEKWPQIFAAADDLTITEDRYSDPHCPANTFGCNIVNNYALAYDRSAECSNTVPDPQTEVGKYFYEWNNLDNNVIDCLTDTNNYFVNAADGNYTVKDSSGLADNHFDKVGRY